jgi:Asp-tRNA(Asn)/Glu-tRNA(Gln) amidotransferase C subunit
MISDSDYKKLTSQAQLTLDPDEAKEIHSQLNEALSAITVFDELDTKHIARLTSLSISDTAQCSAIEICYNKSNVSR